MARYYKSTLASMPHNKPALPCLPVTSCRRVRVANARSVTMQLLSGVKLNSELRLLNSSRASYTTLSTRELEGRTVF